MKVYVFLLKKIKLNLKFYWGWHVHWISKRTYLGNLVIGHTCVYVDTEWRISCSCRAIKVTHFHYIYVKEIQWFIKMLQGHTCVKDKFTLNLNSVIFVKTLFAIVLKRSRQLIRQKNINEVDSG